MAGSYGEWTVQRLKVELLKRGAVVTGRKKDLVERLEAYDRNCNFNNIDISLEHSDIEWPQLQYTSLHLSHHYLLENLDASKINSYFHYRRATDNSSEHNIQAVRKGQLLLNGNRVEACSIAVQNNEVYVTGMVRAAMKKKVSYNYKARLSSAGTILNTDCECPAGKGPHSTCKHVAATLLMLATFAQEKKLMVGRSCTEQLQTFHKPKRKHEGSPVKAEQLPKVHVKTLQDPRPVHMRQLAGYNDFVRSAVVNYCSTTGHDLTIRYLYAKADLSAAVRDHDYLSQPFTEFWIDSALQVTDAERANIERQTRKQAESSTWHEERKWRITASRFGDVTHATDRRCRSKLCKSILAPPKLWNAAVVHGKELEAVAKTVLEKQLCTTIEPAGLFVCTDRPWLGASPDGIVGDDAIVEIKCPYRGRNSTIVPSADFPFLEYKDGKPALKEHSKYFCQVQGQLYITRRRTCMFFVYTHVDTFLQQIEFDSEYCVQSMLPKLDSFYHTYYRKYIAKSLE